MASVLLLYSTVDGQTARICERLRAAIELRGHRATLASIDSAAGIALGTFDKVVIGASVRYGRHRSNVARFMRGNQHRLSTMPNAFFSVSIVARKPNKNTPETNPYVRKFLRQIPWRPRLLGVFAGRLDSPRYGFWDRQIIRFIMRLTGGPTNPRIVVEFTDWQQVERFGEMISEMQ